MCGLFSHVCDISIERKVEKLNVHGHAVPILDLMHIVSVLYY